MKLLLSLIIVIVLVAFPYSSNAGDRVDGSKVILLNSSNNQIFAMIPTDINGEFGLINIEKGNYVLALEFPETSLVPAEKDSLKLIDFVNSACDKSQGRLIFQYRKNCFVFDLDCELQKLSKFEPSFLISEKNGIITITIANAFIEGNSNFKGLFQRLSIKSYERCFKSGDFKIIEN